MIKRTSYGTLKPHGFHHPALWKTHGSILGLPTVPEVHWVQTVQAAKDTGKTPADESSKVPRSQGPRMPGWYGFSC